MKKVVIALVVGFVGIQFFQPHLPASLNATPASFEATYQVPAKVVVMLEKACYDCHSNRTSLPWYAHVQPFGWWIAKHVRGGRASLNFDEMSTYRPDDIPVIFEAIREEVGRGTMPLESYTWMHREAVLTDAEKKELAAWALAQQQKSNQ